MGAQVQRECYGPEHHRSNSTGRLVVVGGNVDQSDFTKFTRTIKFG